MSACNRISINFDALAGSSDIDEETWLIEPPPDPSHSDSSTQSSGHLIEWLQGASLSVDYGTRSALARRLAAQAAKKKKKKAENLAKAKLDDGCDHLCGIEEAVTEEDHQKQNTPKVDTAPVKQVSCPPSDPHLTNNLPRGREAAFAKELSNALMACQISSPDAVYSDSDDEFYDASSEFPLSSVASPLYGAETRVVEKVKPISHGLSALSESPEAASTNANAPSAEAKVTLSARSVEMTDAGMRRSPRQSNTARVAPTVVMTKSVSRSPRNEVTKSPRAPPLSLKSHSVANPDLKDIQQIAEEQQEALRREMMQLQRKPSSQSDNGRSSGKSQARSSPLQTAQVGSAMASSRSVDFFDSPVAPIATSTPSPPHASNASRLPTLVRKGRSMIPTPSTRVPSRVAIRGFAGGSTPSLATTTHRPSDSKSECGQSDNGERWTDECF